MIKVHEGTASVSPAKIPLGSTAILTASGFPPNVGCGFIWEEEGGGTGMTMGTTDQSGSVSTPIFGNKPGTVHVTVSCGGKGATVATCSFEVLAQ